MDPVTSLQNPRIKALVKLRERKHRERSGLMVLDELRLVERALAAGVRVEEVFACPELLERHDAARRVMARLEEEGIEVAETTRPVMEKAAYRQNPEGIVATAAIPARDLDDLDLPDVPLVLVLENVEKPGNLGAVVRTASGAGVDAVLACGVGADPWNPNCLRASTGAVFTVPTVAAERDAIVERLRSGGVTMVATTPDTETLHTDTDLGGPTAVLLGAEDTGLGPELLAAADARCRIPMLGSADSLNVSVAAAVMAYEAVRQRSLSS